MLTLHITPILNEREVKNHFTYLCKNGFNAHTAHRLLNHQEKSITYVQLETLCTLLHCTPNDLFVWTPKEGQKSDPSQPLHKLVPPNYKTLISQSLSNLPIEKLREIRKMIDEQVKNSQ
ncbi:MAG: helix-turn-helix transcriptional regulator [Chitinophagales bacterium]